MNFINDQKFQEICSLLYKVFFDENKIKKINIFLSEKKLINIKYENLAHLLGIQYYIWILNWSKDGRKKDFFKLFVLSGKDRKITFSTIVKKLIQIEILLKEIIILKELKIRKY